MKDGLPEAVWGVLDHRGFAQGGADAGMNSSASRSCKEESDSSPRRNVLHMEDGKSALPEGSHERSSLENRRLCT